MLPEGDNLKTSDIADGNASLSSNNSGIEIGSRENAPSTPTQTKSASTSGGFKQLKVLQMSGKQDNTSNLQNISGLGHKG